VLGHESVRQYFAELLPRINLTASGSASRIAWLHLLDTPPSVDQHEMTDKGSINQRAVLSHRADLIERLYAGQAPEQLIRNK
jgi:feruloyl-CoA synthase